MNRKGIGWFKLELVSYPDNTCFLDTIIKDKSYEFSIVDYTNRKDCFITNEHKEKSVLDKETNKQIIIERTTEVIAK